MNKIKVYFCDVWPEFNYENIFLPILQKHFDVEVTANNPDVIIHSIYNGFKETPKYKCKKILFLGENYRPSQFGSNYSISFDPHTDNNYHLPLWQVYLILRPELKDKLFNRINHESFDKFCSFTVSNGNNFFRNGFFDQLNAYKYVNSYGRFRTNDQGLQKISHGGYWRDAKFTFFCNIKHKFSIAFENNSYPGYTTEKIMDAFLGASIPLYWGDPKIKEDWNEKAFINVMKFYNKDLMEYIKFIDNDDNEFFKMYNEPIFIPEQRKKHLQNIENFESWFIQKIKE